MVKKLISITTAVVLTVLPFTSRASITATFDAETKIVTVEGSANGEGDVQLVVVDIIPEDEEFKSLTHDTIKDHAKYLRQIDVTEGSYTHTFKLPSYGVYTVFAGDGTTAGYKAFSAYSPNFAADFKAQTTESLMREYLETEKTYMRVEIPVYYTLGDKQGSVISTVFPIKDTLTDLASIALEINFFSLLQKLPDILNDESVKLFADLTEELGAAEFEKYEVYSKSDTDFKAAVLKRIAANAPDSTDGARDAFNMAVLLEQVKTAANYQLISQLADDAKALFGVSTPEYDALGDDTKTADMQVMKKDYSTVELFIEELEKKAEDAAQAEQNVEKDNNTSSGRRTSSGVSSSKMNISAPAVSTPAVAEQKTGFADVGKDRWSYECIDVLARRNIVSGDGSGNFYPEAPVTREEFVKMAISAFELTDPSASCDFADVDKDRWSYPYIASAKKYAIVSGVSDIEFAPQKGITREEAAVIINNLAAFKNIALAVNRDKPVFEDSDSVSPWAAQAVEYLYQCEVINGKSQVEFAPKASITREETAKLIFTLLQKIS